MSISEELRQQQIARRRARADREAEGARQENYGTEEGDIIHCGNVVDSEFCLGHFTCGSDGLPVEDACSKCGTVPNVIFTCPTMDQRFVARLDDSGQLLRLMDLCHDDAATLENTSDWPNAKRLICTVGDGEEKPHPMQLLSAISARQLAKGADSDDEGRSAEAR